MTALKRVIIGLVTLIVLIVVIGFLLPRQVHVERSIVINAPQAQLFEALNSFKRFNEFSPWAALDPNTQYTYEGPESGVGAKMSWVSNDPDLGSGTNEIVESRAPDLIRTKTQFRRPAGRSELHIHARRRRDPRHLGLRRRPRRQPDHALRRPDVRQMDRQRLREGPRAHEASDGARQCELGSCSLRAS